MATGHWQSMLGQLQGGDDFEEGFLNPIQVGGGGGGGNHLRPPTALDTGAYNLFKRTQNGSVIQVWPFCAH
jgi:hypothetical protein